MEIPLVTSDFEARHEGHELDAFGAIGIPHMQHSTFTIVPLIVENAINLLLSLSVLERDFEMYKYLQGS